MVGETGIWTDEEAYAHAFSYYTARYIANYFEKDKRVIDFGCGKGTYLQYLKDVGFTGALAGVDGNKLSDVDFDNIYIADLTQPTHYSTDNLISIEVFEHIPPQFERQFVANIVTACRRKLVISVAVEGQPGIGHVNCKNNDYVINLFEGYGFKFNAERTKEIRSTVEPHVSYLKNTLMIFER